MNYQLAADTTEFLVAKTGSCFGYWAGRMTKVEQMALFGHYFGKGVISINGVTEEISHSVKVSFGTDTETTKICSFGGKLFNNNNCTTSWV